MPISPLTPAHFSSKAPLATVVQTLYPAHFFLILSYPRPIFFIGYPAQNSDYLAMPISPLTPAHFSSKGPLPLRPHPHPPNPRALVLPHVSIESWIFFQDVFYVSFKFQIKVMIKTTNHVGEKRGSVPQTPWVLPSPNSPPPPPPPPHSDILPLIPPPPHFSSKVPLSRPPNPRPPFPPPQSRVWESLRDLKMSVRYWNGPWSFDWAERWTDEMWSHKPSRAWWNLSYACI